MNFKINFGVRMSAKVVDNYKETCKETIKKLEDKIVKDLGLENDMTIYFFGITEDFRSNPTKENFEKVWSTYLSIIAEQIYENQQEGI